jgi:dTDP-L-rhamnose 4-epimerase
VLADADGAGRAPEITGRYRIGDVRHVVGDPATAERALGFRAAVAPDEGLVRFASDPLRRPPAAS